MKVGRCLLGVVCLAALSFTTSGSAGLIAGTDRFESTAHASITLYGKTDTVVLRGQSTVRRDPPKGDTIPTEMLQLNLTGTTSLLGGGNLIIRAGSGFGLERSKGVIDAHFDRKGGFFAGNSTFTLRDARFSFFPENPNTQPVHGDIAKVTVGTWISTLPPNVPVTKPRPIPRIDHFKCYEIKSSGFQQKTLALADEFEPEKAKLLKPISLCAPVSKNRAPIRLSTVHLKCYSIQSSTSQPKKKTLKISATDQFGTHTLKVSKPESVCAPTLKARSILSLPKTDPGKLLDSFKCYAATESGAARGLVVRLEDQFEVQKARIGLPSSLCQAVDVNRAGVLKSEAHLTCSPIKNVSRRLKSTNRTYFVRNAYGREKVVVGDPISLCLPASKVPPCSQYAEKAKAALTANGQNVGRINSALHVPYEGQNGSPCE